MSLPPASPNGFKVAAESANEFARDLLDESGRIAHRYGSEQASPDHVRAAAEHLYRSGRSKRAEYGGTFGGLLAGVGASALVGFLQASDPNSWYIGGSAAVMVIGVIIAMLGL